jgi:hypothetical protein
MKSAARGNEAVYLPRFFEVIEQFHGGRKACAAGAYNFVGLFHGSARFGVTADLNSTA